MHIVVPANDIQCSSRKQSVEQLQRAAAMIAGSKHPCAFLRMSYESHGKECNDRRQQHAPYVGLGMEPDLGSMAPDAAPPGLREREGGPGPHPLA